MAVCRSTKANGEPCTLSATGPHGFCWAHDPANREKRRQMASRAARSKPSKEIATIKTELATLYADAVAGRVDKGSAAVGAQIQNVRLRCLDVERRWRELDELESRIEALEAEQEPEGGSRWRA
jgi:hypothetical protein